MTHVAVVSDLHGHLPEIPECDLLLIAGDITPSSNHAVRYQREWLLNEFSNWLTSVPAEAIVGIGGNHDFALEDDPTFGHQLPWVYLDNEESLPIQGLKIWGSPMSNQFYDWAFMTTEAELGEIYQYIPRDVDIIITHGPPYGYGDRVPDSMARGHDPHVGSISLAYQLEFDEWPNLKLVVSGHIHSGYGIRAIKDFAVVNAALVDESYKPVHPIQELEL